jgi:glutamyl-tRNA reductase
LADRGAAWLTERIGHAPGSVIVAGTGEMGRLAATRVAERGHRVSVVSASAERGGRLLEALPGDGHRLTVGSITAGNIAAADALVLAVRSRTPVVTAELIGRAQPWVLDMSSPSAVDAGAAERLADQLMTLDSLGTLAGRTPVLSPAVERRLRADLEREVDEFVAWLDARRGVGALEMLHGGADAVRRRHLARLRRRTPLDARQLQAVEAAATAMVGELLHGPSIELRRGGTDAETVRRLFGLEE